MNEIKRPVVADKSDPRYFELRTAQVKANKTDDGKMVIVGVASSSAEDRMGDVLTDTCQVSMLEQLREPMTMWLNHSYEVPEDILGTCAAATLSRADDGVLELVITVEISADNPRAVKAWTSIDRGIKLGFSIGGYFKDFDFATDSWGLIVNDLELLEISLVGIPANPRAYTKSLLANMTSRLSAEVVKRAEAIVADAQNQDEARVLVRKSFGLETATDTGGDAPTTCAHIDGCEEAKADDSLLCPKHRDEAPLLDADAVNDDLAGKGLDAELEETPASPPDSSTKAVGSDTDMVIECMKCISQMCAHGICTEAATSAKMAHAMLKSMLPPDCDIPGDALLDDTQDGKSLILSIDADTSAIEAKLAELATETANAEAARDAVKAQHEQLTAEVQNLEQKAAELKATPTGRSTQASYSGGSPKGRGDDVSAYYASADELSAAANRQARGDRKPADARDAIQSTVLS